MKNKRLNNNFLYEFRNYAFSKIRESKVYLVGSARFQDYFIKIESILQIKYKKLVSICSIDGLLNKKEFSTEEWEILQEIALRKLEYQEAILIIDVNDYIGHHSREEIEFFTCKLKRPVYYLSKLKV
ncbi:MAG: hypothetical protein ACFFB0_20675 [Promethearchaeota archaeon]